MNYIPYVYVNVVIKSLLSPLIYQRSNIRIIILRMPETSAHYNQKATVNNLMDVSM